MKNLKIAICCDHAGYQLKEHVKQFLGSQVEEIKDFGTNSEESCDYPDYAHPMAEAVESGEYNFGISICGSGNGISMTANKHQGIRCALCWNEEISALARSHNDANVCSLPARFISVELAEKILSTFFTTEFEGGRHIRRIEKMPLR